MFIYLGIVAVLAIWAVVTYNRGVKLRNKVEEAWSGVSVQLKRRYDLIPNLVNTVKGYAEHEQETLEKVIELRNRAQSASGKSAEEQAQMEQQLSAGIRGIFALAENYPDLKANQNFADLQASLTEIEDHIQKARRYYNAVVRDNNNYVETFPSMIIARAGGFYTFSYFEMADEERENVKVTF